jgi:hypothetical protein
MNGYDYSWITEGIVVFGWGITPWFFYILMRESGRSLSQAWRMFGLIDLWAAFSWAMVKVDLGLRDSPLFQLRPLIILTLAIVIALAAARRLTSAGLNQKYLVGLQLFRVIGMVFVLEWSRGNLPGVFAHPAGWGDLTVALAALVVLIRYRKESIPRRAVFAVATLGLADFASAFLFGFLSSATPLQLFSFDFPNRVIEYPTGLIPLFLVPFAVVFHILSIAEANRRNRDSLGKE